VNEKMILAAMEPLLKEVVELGRRLDALAREPGPPGEKGEPGRDAEAPPIEDIARAIAEKHAELLRGPQGKPGADAPDVDIVELAEYISVKYTEMLRPDPPAALDVAICIYEKFGDQLRGLKGDPGTDGKDGQDGRDGLDRPIVGVVDAQKGVQLECGTTAYYAGGVWQATKKTIGDPAEDPQAYRIVCNGVSEVSHAFDANERAHTIHCRLSDGQQFDLSWGDGPRLRVDGDGLKSIAGDIRVEDSMLEQHDGEKWKPQHSLKGERGADGGRGRKGMRGEPGVGLKSLDVDAGVVHIELTAPIEMPFDTLDLMPGVSVLTGKKDEEGRVAHLAVSFEQREESQPQGAIRRFAGEHQQNKRYMQGDLVTGRDGVYLALQNTKRALADAQGWQPIFKAPTAPAPTTGYMLQRERWQEGTPRSPSTPPEPGLCIAKAGAMWFAEASGDGWCWVEERP